MHFQREKFRISGVNLLDPNRIRATSSEVSRHLKCYNKIDKRNSKPEETLALKNTCLQRVNSIIPHHCGNDSHCKCKSIERSEKIVYGLSIDNNYFSLDIRLITNDKCSKISRLKEMNVKFRIKYYEC